jgi:hypothetical protein
MGILSNAPQGDRFGGALDGSAKMFSEGLNVLLCLMSTSIFWRYPVAAVNIAAVFP